jgi:predicted transcriptional regulator
MSENGLVTIKNIDRETYVTITKKGDEASEQFLQVLNTYFDREYGYLIILWMAKTTPIFRSFGKEIDDSIYFSLNWLGEVAISLKQIAYASYNLSITYDRIEANRIYTMMSNTGLVVIKKMEDNTYLTTTKKGDDVSKYIAGTYG